MTLPKSRPNVLLVDDVEANLLALEAQLGHLNCELIRATSGNDALRQLLKREYAVMLLDVQMPDMDGYEVARYARSNPHTREVPIVFVTAMLETEEDILRGYGTGAVDYLFKPINPYVLRSKVQVFLDLYLSRHKLALEIEANERSLADLEAFNYSVSHDLRAPLRSLDGYSRALLEDNVEKLDAQSKHYLERTRSAAQRMSQLIDDLLRLTRISRVTLSRQPTDLVELARSIMAELAEVEPARRFEFVTCERAPVEGDTGLLRIALENLLRNAWKFTQKNPQARIEFGTRAVNGASAFFVADDGAGFDPRFADRLFMPFQRLHTGSDFEGTGIGLAIVHRILGHHGGRIWAEGAPDRGATFLFTVPGGNGSDKENA
jgi:two-component system, sensor histidine kinase and response regulator